MASRRVKRLFTRREKRKQEVRRLERSACHVPMSKVGNTPNGIGLTLNIQLSKVPCIHWIITDEFYILVQFALRPAKFQIQDCQNMEMHRITSQRIWILNFQKYPAYIDSYIPSPNNFSPFRSTTSCLPNTELHLNTLLSKAPCIPSEAPVLVSRCCTTSCFRDTRLRKIGNAPNELRLTLNIWLSQYHVFTEYFTTRPNCGPVCSTTSVFANHLPLLFPM